MTRTTHTYAVLEVSPAVYAEIRAALETAGYDHVFHTDAQHGVVIDMHGIALARREANVADVCGGCGGPYQFDTTIPSSLWNRVVRAKGGSEYLCLTCIVRRFAEAGESFTAELWSTDIEQFGGYPIAVQMGPPKLPVNRRPSPKLPVNRRSLDPETDFD